MTRWRCRFHQPLLVDYADDALDDARRQRVDRHLASCRRCSEDLDALRTMPSLLQSSSPPDPGEEFWRLQRQTIGRAVGNLPAPHAGWQMPSLAEIFGSTPWRFPVAVTASVLAAVLVYRVAERPPQPEVRPADMQVAALDSDALLAAHEMMHTLVPSDTSLAQSFDDTTLLAALPLGDFVGVNTLPPAPQANELSESELESVDDLFGGIG